MTEEISRRDMVVLAGAGIALSGCSGKSATGNTADSSSLANGKFADLQIKGFGQTKPHGLPTTLDPKDVDGLTVPYDPGFIAVLFIDFVSGWKMVVNHASWSVKSGSDENSRLAKAIEVLKYRTATSPTTFGKLTGPLQPYKRVYTQPKNVYDMESFQNFRFKTQNEIFIYLNSPDIVLYPNCPVIFTEQDSLGGSANENHSFFKAQIVPEADMGGLKGVMIRMRNYVTDKDLKSITTSAQNQSYSMNIPFGVNVANATVTMVIDPDTGNGTGNEP